jgi:molybdopterin synthase catalytic subunit
MMEYTQEQLAELRKLLERNHATEDGFLTTREAGAVAYFVGFVEQLIRQRDDENVNFCHPAFLCVSHRNAVGSNSAAYKD